VDGAAARPDPGARRARLLAACGIALAVAGAAAGAWMGTRRRAPRPNIVLVVWDTCRADRVSAMGYGRPTTPRLEALAAGGVRFRHCVSPAPWTPPAHASLFTGLLPSAHGLTVARGERVRPGIPLLAETLRDEGYATACITANGWVSPLTGLTAGFDSVHEVWGRDQQKRRGEDVVAAARAWLAGRAPGDARPVFLFVNFMDTHMGYHAPDEDLAAVRPPDFPDDALRAARAVTPEQGVAHTLGASRLPGPTLEGLRVLYDGAVRHADRRTGELLDLLDGAGLLEGALVAVTSDHGESLGERGDLGHLAALHEPLLRVPLVLRQPGRFEGGRTVDAVVRLQDLHPTILEAAGVRPPSGTARHASTLSGPAPGAAAAVSEVAAGTSLLEGLDRFLPGLPARMLERFALSGEAIRAAPEPADAAGPAKLVRWTRPGHAGGAGAVEREELYLLGADPGEDDDRLAAGRATEADRAAARLLADLREKEGAR
jgi:arylsulfatase A-like enzyme